MLMSVSKVCAVFGFGPGLGKATACKWAAEGFHVVLLSRSLEKLKAAESDISNSKGFACDVTDPTSVESAVSSIENELGPIHTVIYNAGSGSWKTWDKIELDQFDMAMKTNVNGLLKATQLIAPDILVWKTLHGRIRSSERSTTTHGSIFGERPWTQGSTCWIFHNRWDDWN